MSLMKKFSAYRKPTNPISESAFEHKDRADDPKAGQSEPSEL